MERQGRLRRQWVEKGIAQGQMMFWDATLDKWVHTEVSELFWDDTAKRFTARGIIVTGGSVLGLNSVVFQPNADSTTFLQVLDAAGASILNLDSTNRQVTVGKTSEAYPFLIKSTGGSDQIEIYHDNNNAYFKWTDGELSFQTDEGTNTNTSVVVKGKGTGYGILQIYAPDDSDHFRLDSIAGRVRLWVVAASPIAFDLQHTADASVRLFISAAEGQTQEFRIYGFGTGFGGKEHLKISVEKYAANTAEFMNVDDYLFGGNLITLNDTHSDADGARVTRHDFKGEQSGGEQSTLARIEVGHDGTGDDQKGYLDIFTNSGSDGDSPTKRFRVDAAGNTYIGDGGVTNFLKIEPDGTLEFNGTATTFNDIVISLSSARVPAANAPSWDSFIGNLNAYAYAVNDFQEFSTELSHSYKNGATIEFHVHGAVNGADGTDRTIKFEIEYTIADVQPESGFGDVYPATTTINAELTIPASTTDLTAFTIDIGDDTTGNFVQGAIVKGRIRRIASSGSEPSADPFLTEVGIHIESDTIGTRTATSK